MPTELNLQGKDQIFFANIKLANLTLNGELMGSETQFALLIKQVDHCEMMITVASHVIAPGMYLTVAYVEYSS